MSIVIDTNTFSMVFDESNKLHEDFRPVKVWLHKGDGFLIFGGTKYIAELAQSIHRLRLVRRLKEAGIAVQIRDDVVDKIAAQISELTNGTVCNDQHVMALLVAARCSLLCSLDSESYPFVKQAKYYPKGAPRVRIYSSAKNVDLLVRCRMRDIRNACAG